MRVTPGAVGLLDTTACRRGLPEVLGRHRRQRIQFSGDLQTATRESKAVFIAVGTPPTETGDADLYYVESVARAISGAVDGYKVVVKKSTVPVYMSLWIRTIIPRNGAEPGAFDVDSNPECLREGTAVADFLYPDSRQLPQAMPQNFIEYLPTLVAQRPDSPASPAAPRVAR